MAAAAAGGGICPAAAAAAQENGSAGWQAEAGPLEPTGPPECSGAGANGSKAAAALPTGVGGGAVTCGANGPPSAAAAPLRWLSPPLLRAELAESRGGATKASEKEARFAPLLIASGANGSPERAAARGGLVKLSAPATADAAPPPPPPALLPNGSVVMVAAGGGAAAVPAPPPPQLANGSMAGAGAGAGAGAASGIDANAGATCGACGACGAAGCWISEDLGWISEAEETSSGGTDCGSGSLLRGSE